MSLTLTLLTWNDCAATILRAPSSAELETVAPGSWSLSFMECHDLEDPQEIVADHAQDITSEPRQAALAVLAGQFGGPGDQGIRLHRSALITA